MAMALHRRLASLSLHGPAGATLSFQASASTNSCRASTSYLHPSSPATTAPRSSAFHTSSIASEKKRKMVARLRRKANLSRREEAVKELRATAPDPIRGYGPRNEHLWNSCELKRILLDKDAVWASPQQQGEGSGQDIAGKVPYSGALMLPSLENSRAAVLGPEEPHLPTPGQALPAPAQATATATTTTELAGLPVSGSSENGSSTALVARAGESSAALADSTAGPRNPDPVFAASMPYLNFGLSAEDASLLFEKLPAAHAFLTSDTPTAHENILRENIEKAKIEEDKKVDVMKRILDLRNANSRGIRFENTRRILHRFGQGQGSGRSEVQAAILTMRIHSLADHRESMPRDIHSKRGLRALVMQRAKVLKYLKRQDLARYAQCLKDIGVEQRAVEGEIMIVNPPSAKQLSRAGK